MIFFISFYCMAYFWMLFEYATFVLTSLSCFSVSKHVSIAQQCRSYCYYFRLFTVPHGKAFSDIHRISSDCGLRVSRERRKKQKCMADWPELELPVTAKDTKWSLLEDFPMKWMMKKSVKELFYSLHRFQVCVFAFCALPNLKQKS